MATSGTHNFNLSLDTVIQEAYERLGDSAKGGYDLVTARRSLNLLLIKWMNDGVNLFTLDLEDTRMKTDQDHVSFSSSTYSDVLDASVGDTSGTDIGDIPLERISFSDYLDIPNKASKGKPIQYAVERNAQYNQSGTANHKVYLWPVPDKTYVSGGQTINAYVFKAWMIKYPDDVGWSSTASGQATVGGPYVDYTQNVQIPKRFLPPLISGLTVELANKLPGSIDIQRRQELTAIYNEEWEKARAEDRERAAFVVQPSIPYI